MINGVRALGVFVEQVILVNFRKEIRPFIPKKGQDHGRKDEEADDDCSDVLLVSESAAFAAHNEDASPALLGHTYVLLARPIKKLLNLLVISVYPIEDSRPIYRSVSATW